MAGEDKKDDQKTIVENSEPKEQNKGHASMIFGLSAIVAILDTLVIYLISGFSLPWLALGIVGVIIFITVVIAFCICMAGGAADEQLGYK